MQASPDLSRVLILATHPDDDVIGAGGLIQRAYNVHGDPPAAAAGDAEEVAHHGR